MSLSAYHPNETHLVAGPSREVWRIEAHRQVMGYVDLDLHFETPSKTVPTLQMTDIDTVEIAIAMLQQVDPERLNPKLKADQRLWEALKRLFPSWEVMEV